MKRQLSLVLALVMILGTFTTVFAADTSTDAITEASTFLKDKGVLVGNMSGDLMLGEKLSRQDTAILVSRLMGEYDVAKDFPTAENIPTYEDIKDNFYLPVLAWAQANKTFVGHSAARFGFDDNVTAQEYSKVLLVALGYEVGPETNLDLTWEATLQKAKDLGILKNINDDIKNTDEITRGEMAVMTFNALSVMMKDGTKTLAEKLNIVMPAATKLTAKVNDTKNLKEVVIELSNAKLADSDRLMDASNYKIKGVSVKEVRVDGNDVIVTVEKELVKGRTYELTVRNVETGLNGTYNFKADDNTQPTVEKVTVLGEYGIKITASEPIKDAKERNFLVDGKNISMDVETYGRDIIITPYYNEQFSDKADTLTIKEIEDFAGYKSVEKDFDIKIIRDDVAPKVTDVVAKGNKIEVTFDKDVYKKSVASYDGRSSVGNISYSSGRQTVYATAAKKIDTNVVEYTFDSEMPRRTDVTIEGVQNHSKVAMTRVTESPRVVVDNTEPEIIDKKVTTIVSGNKKGEAEIELTFNKAVDANLANNNIKEYFTLYEREAYRGRKVENANITARFKDSKKEVVIVTIKDLTEYNKDENDLNYVLEVENFADATSSRNIMYRDYVDFKVTAKSDFKVETVTTKPHYTGTEITVKFSKALDKVQAEEFSNYLFKKDGSTKLYDVRDLKGSVYLENDGKTVTIILPEDQFKVKDFDEMTILRTIKDRDGNRLSGDVDYFFETGVTGEQATQATTVKTSIAALPVKAAVTLANEDAVVAARTAYNKLSDAQKVLVGNIDKLTDAEAKIAELKNQEKAALVDGQISALRLPANINSGDRNAIEAARTAYNNLTDAEKLEVNNLAVLVAAEKELNDLQAATDEVQAAEDNKTQANVTTAQTAIDKLTNPTTKGALQTKLDAVQDQIDVNVAKAALTNASLTMTDATANPVVVNAPATANGVTYFITNASDTGVTTTGAGAAATSVSIARATGGSTELTLTMNKGLVTETQEFTVTVPATGAATIVKN